jgi:hypothetical protein
MVGTASGSGLVATYLNWSHVRLLVTSQNCGPGKESLKVLGFEWACGVSFEVKLKELGGIYNSTGLG